MKLHELKIEYEYAVKVMHGKKKFEIRKNDRDYKIGDLVVFKVINTPAKEREYIYAVNGFEDTIFKISYIFYGGGYGLEKDYCVFSIESVGHIKW